MRLTRAKLLLKKSAFGRRDYFVIRLRHLLQQSPYVLFLTYDGDSSPKLGELRALAANYSVGVQLMFRRWASSVFTFKGSYLMPFHCRLVVLYSSHAQKLLKLSQDPSFPTLLRSLPFYAHSYGGLLSQQPYFSLLLENPVEDLLVFLYLLQYQLLPLISLTLSPLLPFFYFVAWRQISSI